MTEEDAFIQAIIESSDDDTPRLVYADWLEERGDVRAAAVRRHPEVSQFLSLLRHAGNAEAPLRQVEAWVFDGRADLVGDLAQVSGVPARRAPLSGAVAGRRGLDPRTGPAGPVPAARRGQGSPSHPPAGPTAAERSRGPGVAARLRTWPRRLAGSGGAIPAGEPIPG